jgi:hypothetical protein
MIIGRWEKTTPGDTGTPHPAGRSMKMAQLSPKFKGRG